MRTLRTLSLSLLAVVASACGPSWMVVKQASPNPLVNQKQFTVLPIDFSQMKIGNPGSITVDEWVAKKKPDEQGKFKEDLAASEQRMNEMLDKAMVEIAKRKDIAVTPAQAPAGLTVKPVVTDLEPGYNAFVATAPAVVRIEAHVMDANGQDVDVVAFKAQADAGSFGDMKDRLGATGDNIGGQIARYLDSRVKPAQ